MDFPKEFTVFGYDWLGRCFAIDLREKSKGRILMFEIGTADILEIPVSFENFLNDEIPNYSNECLASDFFEEWKEQSNAKAEYGSCVAYKVPLFLNGEDDLCNLEVSDMEVYWGIIGQLIPRG